MNRNEMKARFAKLFDHSIVRPDATWDDVVNAANVARACQAATLTVQPYYISLALEVLGQSEVLVGTVVGFPHGNETPSTKEYQTNTVLELGAQEIDMVMNIPALKNGDKTLFMHDIGGVLAAAQGAKVKVITENCYLSRDQKREACRWIAETGAHFVKTSTAYAQADPGRPNGATLDDVRLMYEAVDGRCQVKAAGGIREVEEILDYLRAGARRFGSTRTDQFLRAFDELPDEAMSEFGEFLVELPA
jgi:deoxyribose-phosphate aldolase